MSMKWTFAETVYEWMRARRDALRWVDFMPAHISTDKVLSIDGNRLTVYLNPGVVSWRFRAKRSCPMWLHNQVNGLGYDIRDGGNEDKEESFHIGQMRDTVAAYIIRRRGYDGYIQDELPF